MQDFMAYLKPSIGEEVEKVFNRIILPHLLLLFHNSVLPPTSSSLPPQAEPSDLRKLLFLKFKDNIPHELLTNTKIQDEGGSLEVELVDGNGTRVEVGRESGLGIKIDVLDGEKKGGGTEEDYNTNIVDRRETKGALLKGKSETALSRGVANVSDISVTDNSATTRTKMFRLGARVVTELPPGVVVKAAASKAFRVKERRMKRDRKHNIPSPLDELWRLVNIGKNGAVYNRAVEERICTVKDLLQRHHTYPNDVQRILNVPDAKWNEIVKNAEACNLTNDHPLTYHDEASGDVIMLDCAFNILSITFGGQVYQPFMYEDLNDSQKEHANALRRAAYEKRGELETRARMKEIPNQKLLYPSCIQGLGQQPPLQQQQQHQPQQQQPQPLPPPSPPPPPPLPTPTPAPALAPASVDFVVGGLSEGLDTGHVRANQMCINSQNNNQHRDASATYQGGLLEGLHTGHITTNQMCINSSNNNQHRDAGATYQGRLSKGMDTGHIMANQMCINSPNNNHHRDASVTYQGGLSEGLDTGDIIANQMCINSPNNNQHRDAGATYQVNLMENATGYNMRTFMPQSFTFELEDIEQIRALLQDDDDFARIREWLDNTP